MPFPLRPYQLEAVAAIWDAYQNRGVRRPMVVLPTGAGKTIVFAHLVRMRARAGRSLVIAHREELLSQAADKMMRIAPDLTLGIVKAERDEHHQADVVIASVQTIAQPKRIAPLVGTVSTVIVDEAHHAAAQTYRDVLTALGSFTDAGPLTVGVTATAGRGDGVGLGAVWQEIVYQRGIIQMIAEGYLVDVRGLEVMTDLDYRNVRSSHGDFTDASLGLEMNRSGVLDAAAAAYHKYAKDRRGVAFTPTIATAEELAVRLTALGVPAEYLSGRTDQRLRRAILRRLSTGETQVVANCAVLTEGFDEPALSCALIVRPTKSRPLFVQMAGRVLRPYLGKDDALILNLFAPPSAGLATIADLAGLGLDAVPKLKDGESLAEAVAREEDERSRVLNGRRVMSAVTARQVDLFSRSALRWLPADAGFTLPCGETSILLVPAGELWNVVESGRKERRTISSGLTLDWAQGVGEEYARAHGGVISRANARWRQGLVTDPQRSALRKLGLTVPATRGEASDALSAAYGARAIRGLVKA